jgi:hypothetical protein
VLGAKQRQNLRDRLDPFLSEHADNLKFGAGRIGKRPEQIEDGARAKLGPDGGHMAHGGVMRRGKHEAEPAFGNAAGDRLGRGFDIHAKFSQHISRTRARGDRPVAVLGHRHPGAGHHKSRTGRDVEGALAVAASAASVDGALRRAHGQHLGPHRTGSAGDLVHRLPANAHGHQ